MKYRWPLLLLATLLAVLIRSQKIPSAVPFFADQAWFFLSARDSLENGSFPLWGIPTSVNWLHQGPLFTYILIPGLILSRFHPVSGIYISILAAAVCVPLLAFLSRIWFGPKAFMVSAWLWAISPLMIVNSRAAFDTSFIPLFLLLHWLLLIRRKYFLSFLFLGGLWQLELASVVFWPVTLIFMIRHRSPLIFPIFGSILGIIPFIISGFIPVMGLFFWSAYQLTTSINASFNVSSYYLLLISRLVIPSIPWISWSLVILSIALSLFRFKFITVFLFIPLLLTRLNPTSSEAYFIMLSLPLLLLLSRFISHWPWSLALVFLFVATFTNIQYLVTRNFLVTPAEYGISLNQKIQLTDTILSLSHTPNPQIDVIGPGSHHQSYPAPYTYLVWWRSFATRPSGTASYFSVSEVTAAIRVIE